MLPLHQLDRLRFEPIPITASESTLLCFDPSRPRAECRVCCVAQECCGVYNKEALRFIGLAVRHFRVVASGVAKSKMQVETKRPFRARPRHVLARHRRVLMHTHDQLNLRDPHLLAALRQT